MILKKTIEITCDFSPEPRESFYQNICSEETSHARKTFFFLNGLREEGGRNKY